MALDPEGEGGQWGSEMLVFESTQSVGGRFGGLHYPSPFSLGCSRYSGSIRVTPLF